MAPDLSKWQPRLGFVPLFCQPWRAGTVGEEPPVPLSRSNTNAYRNRRLWRADCFLIRHSAGCTQIWQTISRVAQMGELGRLGEIGKT